MQRILVIGCSGAGKSTLARQLHEQLGLPLIHLDRLFWQPGWEPSDILEFRDRCASLCDEPEWIMDGSYFSNLDLRLLRADTVFLLDYPTHLCLRRVLWRMVTGYGRDRPSCAEGCPERFDWAFLQYVLNFREKWRSHILMLLDLNRHLTVHHFSHPRELAQYLKQTEAEVSAHNRRIGLPHSGQQLRHGGCARCGSSKNGA